MCDLYITNDKGETAEQIARNSKEQNEDILCLLEEAKKKRQAENPDPWPKHAVVQLKRKQTKELESLALKYKEAEERLIEKYDEKWCDKKDEMEYELENQYEELKAKMAKET